MHILAQYNGELFLQTISISGIRYLNELSFSGRSDGNNLTPQVAAEHYWERIIKQLQ